MSICVLDGVSVVGLCCGVCRWYGVCLVGCACMLSECVCEWLGVSVCSVNSTHVCV